MVDEEIILTSRTHFKALLPAIIIQIVLLGLHALVVLFFPEDLNNETLNTWAQPIVHLIIIVFELWYVIFPILRWWNETFTLTNYRVMNDWGVLSKHSREIDLTRIVSISVERSFVDRIFGCGSLNFYDAAAGSQPKTDGVWNKPSQRNFEGIKFNDVPNVKEFRKAVEKARSKKSNEQR